MDQAWKWQRRIVPAFATLLLFALVTPAPARTRSQRKPLPVALVLEPFLVARSVAHKVVEPIARKAPAAPVRIAYRSLQERKAGDRPSSVRRPVSPNRPDQDEEPLRVAYLVRRPPKSHFSEEESDEQPDDSASNNGLGGPTVAGSRAILRGGVAYAPAHAPQSVKNAIWAANRLRGKPYLWGGGHGSFSDRGYDCSGTVSYALRGAGAIATPMPSSDFLRYGERGRGRWITIYARSGHTFAVIAGLRLDTTDFRSGGNVGPRWHAEMRDPRGFAARHPAGL